MLLAMVTRAPRDSRCCFAVSMRTRSDGEEIARTAMCADFVIARGFVKCPVPCARCPVTRVPFALGTGHWALRSVERTCKPNSVSPCQGEDHSSVTRVSAVIEQPTRKLSNGNGRFHRFPIWSCSAGGLPCRRRSRGTRCALTAPFHPCLRRHGAPVRRSALCCTFRRVAAPGCYPACYPVAFGLSSPQARRSSDPLHTEKSNRCFAMKIANTKLLQFQQLRTIVGMPTL